MLITASFLTSFTPGIAHAQTVSIETSADQHNGRFFGGMLQVIIEDSFADDDDSDSIDVEVTAEEDGGNMATAVFSIVDTTAGSQRFEFFFVHPDSPDQSPANPVAETVTVIQFGDGAADLVVPGFELYDVGTIEIQYADNVITIDYGESSAQQSVDREIYGSTSLAHLLLADQDGNLDPTTTDTFTVAEQDLSTLFETSGATFADDVTFEETGDNTANFEAVLQLTTVDTPTDPELAFSSESVTLLLNDMANYSDANFDNPENGSTDTSEVFFSIDDVDGSMDALANITFGSELSITVRDNDQNLDSEEQDQIQGALIVSSFSDTELLDMAETDDNSGIFVIDLENSELRITFLEDGAFPFPENGVLELASEDISEDIFVEYVDPLDDQSGQSITAEQTVSMTLVGGTIDLPESTPIEQSFTLTLLDNDLNDFSRFNDLYTIVLEGSGPYPLTRRGDVYGQTAQFEILLQGNSLDFAPSLDPLILVLNETDINSGEFAGEFTTASNVEIDLGELLASAGVDAKDGDELEIIYTDLMGDIPSESSDVMIIGTASPPTPEEMLEELVALAKANGMNTDVLKQSAKLLTDDNPSNDKAVCDKLGAFTNQIDAKEKSGRLSSDNATELRTAAQDLKTIIGCN